MQQELLKHRELIDQEQSKKTLAGFAYEGDLFTCIYIYIIYIYIYIYGTSRVFNGFERWFLRTSGVLNWP